MHLTTVVKKVVDLIKKFSLLISYPKKKRGKIFLRNVKKFMEASEKIFDIFCHDAIQKKEKEHLPKMRDADFAFYEDQKGEKLAGALHFLSH